ncbi:acylneuraminate cytidylyltransferase family protein [Akkermansiaceae bacterium]|nr:acylneuraminate cytidylyltransferase family protein [Akkermansiaceae bacterium]
MKIYAIIPARSGSRGVPDKNIRKIAGKELLGHSINFAKSLCGIDRVICSTDSEKYAEVALRFGAEVPFLRSSAAAADTAMEDDILVDLHKGFDRTGMERPDLLVWLRPTFLFRDLELVQKCITRMEEDSSLSACRIVCESEGRLYRGKDGCLEPVFNDGGASMIRRQDIGSTYKVYSTDVFRFPKSVREINNSFLGSNIGYEVAHKTCGLDIDDEWDIQLVESIVANCPDLVMDFLV